MKPRNFTPFAGAVLVAALGASLAATAADFELGALRIKDPWARATAPRQANGAAYMVIENHGTAPDRLVAADCADAKRAMLHETRMEGGVMRMRPVEAVELPTGGGAELRPGGLHLMLMGVTAPLKQGGTMRCSLTFERAGVAEVTLQVLSAGAMGPD